jgi:hypothetical protein
VPKEALTVRLGEAEWYHDIYRPCIYLQGRFIFLIATAFAV